VVQWGEKAGESFEPLAVYVVDRQETFRRMWRTFPGLVLTVLVAPWEGLEVQCPGWP
jgi:hypothetical protein